MPVAEITRAETAERARLLQVESYDVELDLTTGKDVFRSRAVMRFGCTEPGAASYADLIADTVHEITLNGAPVDPAAAYGDGRISLAGLSGQNELTVVADCRYSHDGTGLHRAVDPADQKVYTYTKFEPAYARTVYANFEQPDLKARFTISVVVPEHWRVLSNEALAEQEPAGVGATRWRFRPTPRLSTYLFAIAAGEYEIVRSSHTTPGGQVIPLALACRASMAQYLAFDDIFEITRNGLDYFTALFQTPYPFAKYDQVFVPEYSVGATENAGCVVFTDQLLFRSRVTDTLYELRASVILHEMAHMWFGDLVTMRWWDDLWLNESFAEFCAVLATAEATPYTGAWTTFATSRKGWGYVQDQLPSTHPVAASVPTLSGAIANFDGISYAKGASVLRQLVVRIGRDRFFAGIAAYFATHGWGNATLTDWLSTLEQSAGGSLADWSKTWLETAGPNTLRSEFQVDGSGAFTEFAVRQEAPAEFPTLRPHRLAIGLYQRQPSSGELTRTSQVVAEVAGPRTVIGELAGVPQPDLVLLNDDDLTYAIVRFDARSMRTLTESIADLTDSLARAVCWTSLLDMVRHAELGLPAFVTMMAAGIATEPSVAALQSLLENGRELLQTLADPARAAEYHQQLAEAASRLLVTAEPGGDHQLAWAQLLSWTATSPTQLDLVGGLLDGSATLPGLSVGSDLRWSLLQRLAASGRAGDAEIDAELARDSTDAGARNATACRAAIPDAEHKAAAWQLLAESADIPVDLLRSVATAFHQPEQATLLAPYARRYFDTLPEIWSASGGHLRVARGAALFPATAASPELIEQIDAFLAAEPREPGLVRVLVERRDQVRRALRCRSLG
ncbi:MAG TPA: aminopeptidase N [Streptosporangiaceae bacterium]|nr:aminopeptidase N [Streptosporangiaceae bacterium]